MAPPSWQIFASKSQHAAKHRNIEHQSDTYNTSSSSVFGGVRPFARRLLVLCFFCLLFVAAVFSRFFPHSPSATRL
jgi:hypothetical protein